jgi:hypothetical protein
MLPSEGTEHGVSGQLLAGDPSGRPRQRSLSRCWCSGRRQATWSLLSRRPPGVEVVHSCGNGPGVPFVMVPS